MLNEDLIIKGPTRETVIPKGCSVGKYLIDCLKKRKANEIFCVDGLTGESLTCKEVLDRTLKTVIILKEFGVKSGDTVAIISNNCLNYFIALYAIFYVGAAGNLLNPAYTTDELKAILQLTKPKAAFICNASLKNIRKLEEDGLTIDHVLLLEQALELHSDDIQTLDDLLEYKTLNDATVEPAEIDTSVHTLLILQSSGTTGLPKCVMMTHENSKHTTAAFSNPDYVGLQPSDVSLIVLPQFHVLGASSIFIAAMYSVKIVLLPSFKPESFLKAIQTFKISMLFATPSLLSFLAQHHLVTKYDLSSLRFVLCSAATLGKETLKEFHERHAKVRICQPYGCTEFSGFATVNHEVDVNNENNLGKIMPNSEGMVWNAALEENVGALETGELCFRGPSIMKGYIKMQTDDIDKFGFYHTGDLGYFDERGNFFFVGRMKEIIKYKGFQVAPLELENVLRKHTSVADCAVIGVPDKRAGEVPMAFVTLHRGASVTDKELYNFVAEKVSEHKHLRGGVRFLPSIPKNAAGKILKTRLLEIYKMQL